MENFAAANITSFQSLVGLFTDLMDTALPVLESLSLLAFFWGLVRFIFAMGGGDTKAIADGKSLMKWGLVALFIMVSLDGIISFLGHEFGFPVFLPLLPTN